LSLLVASAPSAEEPDEIATVAFGVTGMESLAEHMPGLARELLGQLAEPEDGETGEEDGKQEDEAVLRARFRTQLVAGKDAGALRSLDKLRRILAESDAERAGVTYLQYEIFARARLREAQDDIPFDRAFRQALLDAFEPLDDGDALYLAGRFVYRLPLARQQIEELLSKLAGQERIPTEKALELVQAYQPYTVYQRILPMVPEALAAENRRRYAIQDDVLIETPDGATLSAVVVRPRRFTTPQPAALLFNIYSDTSVNVEVAKQAAARGYVGVVVDTRGKRLSPDPIEPWEHEAADTHAVLDWISRQPWSNGKVGMFGASYSAFAQWAATKKPHPALKTIIPVVASMPGFGLPMHNNIFINANYCWAFQVTSSRVDDPAVCRDTKRWDRLVDTWYRSGRPYREIDAVDSTPNPLLQRWLDHPAYDEYWQGMVPWKPEELAKIDIPVLSITGYYDDGQVAALELLRRLEKHNPDADHTLLIGPYDHWGAQWRPPSNLRGYEIDPVARIETHEIIFQWLDHVLRGGDKPALLKDAVNYQVMGTNEWRHAPSLAAVGDKTVKLYLSDLQSDLQSDPPTDGRYRLVAQAPEEPGSLSLVVDLADRTTTHNADAYPEPILRERLDAGRALVFVSEPFADGLVISGQFSGRLEMRLNKKDVDLGIVLYELMPDGRYFHLSWYVGRASHAADMTVRRVLEPGAVESIPILRTPMTSRRLGRGSRLVAVIDVNMNEGAQINYGTGKDVSDESIEDAGEPLRLEILTGSFLEIPISS